MTAVPTDRLWPGEAAFGARGVADPLGEISVYLAGRVVGERYRLEGRLATGGMAQVWRAHDLVLRRPVAVKLLLGDRLGDPVSLARFRAEARLAAGLSHPNVAALHDYGEVGPGPGQPGERLAYLVMELVQGEPLSAVLRREGRLEARRTLEIVRQAAAGLAAAHAAGIVHRDVKPGNLLIGPAGKVTITDFGIARMETSEPITGTGEVVGTAQYLAPEQAMGAVASPASDVYALGVVAYECLAGRRPFEAETPVQTALMRLSVLPEPLPSAVPDGARRLVERAMATDPADRLADGAALAAAVAEALAGAIPAGLPDRAHTTVLPVLGLAPEPPTAPAAATVPQGAPRHAAPVGGPSYRVRLLTAMVLLVALGVAVAMFRSPSPEPAAASEPSPTTAAVPTIGLRAADYVGRPVSEVRTRLTGLGLTVRLRPLPTIAVPPGRVTAVDPVGPLVEGQVVTVTHAVAPPAASSAAPDGAHQAPASTRSAGQTAGATRNSDEGRGSHGRGNGAGARGHSKHDDQD